jgi:integration host factor subunit alpha
MALTKNNIIENVTGRIGFSTTKSIELVETVLETIKSSLEKDDEIMISGFGKFSVKQKAARKGRNPATGSEMILEKRKVVTFKHSGILKNKINGK